VLWGSPRASIRLTLSTLAGLTLWPLVTYPADLATTPTSPQWSGLYAGGDASFNFGSSGSTLDLDRDGASFMAAPASPSSYSGSRSGFLGGLQIGYNWREGPIIFGPEADFSFGGVNATSILSSMISGGTGAGTPFSSTQKSTLEWLSTLRGRIGILPSDVLLVYATGGLAAGGTKYSSDLSFPAVTYAGNRSLVQPGWTAGAGIEYALGSRWTTELEYLHEDLGSATAIGYPPAPSPFHTQSNFSMHSNMLLLRANYRFAGDAVREVTSIISTGWTLPEFLQGITYELGTAYSFSSGAMRYKLYNSARTNLNSQLTYSGLDASSGGIFGRFDLHDGIFVKGQVDLGGVGSGRLKDEDFRSCRRVGRN
jgi:outer membrane immunogenic protein